MRTRLTITTAAILLFVAALVATTSAQGYYPYPPSYALLQALSATQALSIGDAQQLQNWVRQGTFQPPNPVFTQLDQVEAQIAALTPPDRSAIATWLSGGGRGALYARNATDQQIGACKFPIDPPSCTSGGGASPNPQPTDWRSVPFALAPGANDASGIAIDGGFAAVKNDGTAEVHCLTFRNTNPKSAVSITFTYAFYGASDNMLSNGVNMRSGTFSSGISIGGPKNLSDYQTLRGGVGNKDALQNCWMQSSGIANLSYLQATYVTVAVTAVRFDDGTTWPPAAHTAQPAATPQPAASP